MPVPTSGCSCMLCYTDRIGIGGAAILTNRFSRCQCHWCAIFDVYIGQWSFCIIYDYLPTSHGSAPFNRIWNITILRSPKQQIWLRTALCGGWCRRMALCNCELHARNDDVDKTHNRDRSRKSVTSNSLRISLIRKWQLFKLGVFWMSSLACDLERKEYWVGSRSCSRFWRTWFGL